MKRLKIAADTAIFFMIVAVSTFALVCLGVR